MATKQKFDYDSPDFYDAIRELAERGCTDTEIANSMSMLSGMQRSICPDDVWPDFPKLSPKTFFRMKNGNYSKWTEEQNAERIAVEQAGKAPHGNPSLVTAHSP